MAEVDDRWFKTVDGKKVKTDRHGVGKRWRARWRDDAGKQREKSFDRKYDADKHAATVAADMLRKTYVDPVAGKKKLRVFAEEWRAAQAHVDNTQHAVEGLLRLHVYPTFGEREIASIRPSHAQAWVRSLEKGDGNKRPPLMPRTVRTIVTFAVAIGHAAVADKLITANPFVGLKYTKPVKKRVMPPTGDQVAALYEAIPEPWRALVLVGAGLGPRQGEAVALEVDCVDFLHRKIHIRQQIISPKGGEPYLRLPKGGKVRVVAASDVVLNELAEHIRRFPPPEVLIEDRTNAAKPVTRHARLLFTRPGARPIRSSWFSEGLWAPARRGAGLPVELTYHDLRHYFASALIRFGESVKTVQDALGHATAAETLNTYSHLWPDSEDRTRAAIEAAFRGDVGHMWAAGASG